MSSGAQLACPSAPPPEDDAIDDRLAAASTIDASSLAISEIMVKFAEEGAQVRAVCPYERAHVCARVLRESELQRSGEPVKSTELEGRVGEEQSKQP